MTAALAGCGARSTDVSATPTQIEYDHLGQRRLYVADGVDLRIPDAVTTTQTRTDATVLLFPGDPAVDTARAVEWLAARRVVALLGDAAESTWLEWVQSDPYAAQFGQGGYADAQPDPDLIVLVRNGAGVTPNNYTWADGYESRDVFEALEDALGPDGGS